jgi:hypothetical protein
MAAINVSQVNQTEDEETDGDLLTAERAGPRAQWPVLLAMHDIEPDLARTVADLLRSALRSPWGRVVAGVLTRWLRLAERDECALSALEAMLPLLVGAESDRRRWQDLVRRGHCAWADALSDNVVERLTAVIEGVDIGPEEGSFDARGRSTAAREASGGRTGATAAHYAEWQARAAAAKR